MMYRRTQVSQLPKKYGVFADFVESFEFLFSPTGVPLAPCVAGRSKGGTGGGVRECGWPCGGRGWPERGGTRWGGLDGGGWGEGGAVVTAPAVAASRRGLGSVWSRRRGGGAGGGEAARWGGGAVALGGHEPVTDSKWAA